MRDHLPRGVHERPPLRSRSDLWIVLILVVIPVGIAGVLVLLSVVIFGSHQP